MPGNFDATLGQELPPNIPEHDTEDEADFPRRRLRQIRAAVAARRCKVAALLALLDGGQGPQGKKMRRFMSFSWKEHVALLTEEEFKMRYRFTFDGFYDLLNKIYDDLQVSVDKMAKLAKWGQVVEPATKLAITLRYLAGGDPLDLRLIYQVSKAYVYDCVWLTVDAINRAFPVTFPIDDPHKLAELETEFREKARCAGWEGQVGSIDGVHFPMKAPSLKHVKDPMRYYVARKAEYALLCIAICNAKKQITYYDVSQAPTTHDSMAWSATKLGVRVKAGDLPAPYFINGDSAFSLSNSMITPSGLSHLDAFDFHQSSNRVCIECAFGILVRRWAILWKPLQMRFDRRAPLIGACIRLHNLCIEQGQPEWVGNSTHGLTQIQPSQWALSPKFDSNGAPIDYLTTERGMRDRNQAHSYRRDILAQAVADSGLVRPLLRAGICKKPPGRKGAKKK